MFPKPLWCCDCASEVLQKIHPVYYGIWDGEIQFDWCEGSCLCSCPPPELEEDWELYLIEPTEEELILIEREAKRII